MAPAFDRTPRRQLEMQLLRVLLIGLIAVAIVLAASAAFGWTLSAGPSFDLTTNPGAELPF